MSLFGLNFCLIIRKDNTFEFKGRNIDFPLQTEETTTSSGITACKRFRFLFVCSFTWQLFYYQYNLFLFFCVKNTKNTICCKLRKSIMIISGSDG